MDTLIFLLFTTCAKILILTQTVNLLLVLDLVKVLLMESENEMKFLVPYFMLMNQNMVSMCPQLVYNIVKIRKVDHQVFSYGRQGKVNGIEQGARCQAVLWFRPPGLQLFPQPFCQVQVGGKAADKKHRGTCFASKATVLSPALPCAPWLWPVPLPLVWPAPATAPQ